MIYQELEMIKKLCYFYDQSGKIEGENNAH
jgi:hypothetical protein